MAALSSSDYELLTEHFSYPPVSLLDDIINTVNVLADRALGSVERLLVSIPPQKLGFTSSASRKAKARNATNPDPSAAALPLEEAAKLEIENGTHQLETLLNASIDKNFDIFELYVMQNILAVKPHDQPYMRLSHYEGLDFSASQGQGQGQGQQQQQPDKPTTESITALRRRLQASQRLNAALEADKARNDALLRKLRGLVSVQDAGDVVKVEDKDRAPAAAGVGDDGPQPEASSSRSSPFGFLRDKGGLEEGGGDQPITTTTEFTLSQLQALRSLSASLRALLPDLAPPTTETNAAAQDSGCARSRRRERAQYIESSSRRYLETVSGLELGPGGEVRDGEWQGEGRGLSKGEVEGLEKVVAILEGEKERPGVSSSDGGSGGGADEGEAMDAMP